MNVAMDPTHLAQTVVLFQQAHQLLLVIGLQAYDAGHMGVSRGDETGLMTGPC